MHVSDREDEHLRWEMIPMMMVLLSVASLENVYYARWKNSELFSEQIFRIYFYVTYIRSLVE